MSLIVDASVAVKWVAEESGSGAARDLVARRAEVSGGPSLRCATTSGKIDPRAVVRPVSDPGTYVLQHDVPTGLAPARGESVWAERR